MTSSPHRRMSQETALRHAWSLVVVAGLAMLTFALGDQFGLWASGALLLLVGAGFAVPLWRRHLEEQAAAAERARIPQHEYPPPDQSASDQQY